MTRLRKRLAEQYVDPETGEVLDQAPKNKEDMSSGERMQNLMQEKAKNTAAQDFPSNDYQNQWGKVSPINILFVNNMNQLVSQDVESAKQSVLNIIESLNSTYGNDKTYSYFAKDQMGKMKIAFGKIKTIDKLIEYLTNMYMKGIGMGSGGGQKWASKNANITIDLNNKKMLKAMLPMLKNLLK